MDVLKSSLIFQLVGTLDMWTKPKSRLSNQQVDSKTFKENIDFQQISPVFKNILGLLG